jgi:hypothetical protein
MSTGSAFEYSTQSGLKAFKKPTEHVTNFPHLLFPKHYGLRRAL